MERVNSKLGPEEGADHSTDVTTVDRLSPDTLNNQVLLTNTTLEPGKDITAPITMPNSLGPHDSRCPPNISSPSKFVSHPEATPTTTTITSQATPTIPLALPINLASSSTNSVHSNSFHSLLKRHTSLDPYLILPALKRKLYGSPSMVQRLGLERRLKEHEGCVNCINFSWGGRLLASGSDDLQVVLWDWASSKVMGKFDSGHVANVFQVRLLLGGMGGEILTKS